MSLNTTLLRSIIVTQSIIIIMQIHLHKQMISSKPSNNKQTINQIKVTKHLSSWSKISRTNNLSGWKRRDWSCRVCINCQRAGHYSIRKRNNSQSSNSWSSTTTRLIIILTSTLMRIEILKPNCIAAIRIIRWVAITIRCNNSKRTSFLLHKISKWNNSSNMKRTSLPYSTGPHCSVTNNTTPHMFSNTNRRMSSNTNRLTSSNKRMRSAHRVTSCTIKMITMKCQTISKHRFYSVHRVA